MGISLEIAMGITLEIAMGIPAEIAMGIPAEIVMWTRAQVLGLGPKYSGPGPSTFGFPRVSLKHQPEVAKVLTEWI